MSHQAIGWLVDQTGLHRKLQRTFYDKRAEIVAPALLGAYLVRRLKGKMLVGRIVEVEAYLGVEDKASHSSRGRTRRTEVMFGAPGHAYVYLIYGIHHCLNVVTDHAGTASAVLIRALEPVQGIDARTQGPGLLTRAMGIDRSLNGVDLTSDSSVYLAEGVTPRSGNVVTRPRIGVDYAGDWATRPLRFYIRGNRWVSKP